MFNEEPDDSPIKERPDEALFESDAKLLPRLLVSPLPKLLIEELTLHSFGFRAC